MRPIKLFVLLTCIITNIAFLHFEWEISFLTVLLSVFIAIFAWPMQSAMHEIGHLIGGKISGHKLVVLQIGQGNIISSSDGRISFEARRTRGAQCVMLPKEETPLRYRAYNAGGYVANAVVLILSSALLLFRSNIATLVFIEIFFAGCFGVLSNALPRLYGGVPNDGYVLKMLKNNPAVQNDYVKYLQLYSAMFLGEEIDTASFEYEREAVADETELIYYHGIHDLLNDLRSEHKSGN